MTIKQKFEQQTLLSEAHANYAKGLKAYAFFKVHSHATGEDLVQETFMKTWKYLVKGGKVELMKAFLYHILNNLIIDEYRKKKPASLDALVDEGYEPSVDDSKNLSDFLDGKAAMLLIKRLPSSYREVMHMRYVQDLSLEEMSTITGQTKNAIAVQAHRGFEKLRRLYSPYMQEGKHVANANI